MRGFRWQALALMLAVAVFAAAWFTQPEPTPPTPPPTETAQPDTPTPPPTENVAVLPTSTPMVIAQVNTTSDNLVTFREGLVGNIRRLNPLLVANNDAEAAITSLIFEGLVTTNEYGEPVPALATEWIIADNRIEYVFRLRDDVLWHDGTPFTAQDVAFTMELLRSPDFPGDPTLSAFWRTVETQVLGEHLIRFRLAQPLGSFLDALQIGILPEHALRGTTANTLSEHPFNLTPVGTGPYQFEAARTTDGSEIRVVDLRLAPVYRARNGVSGTFQIERVRFITYDNMPSATDAFVAGDIDALAAPSDAERLQLLGATNAPTFTRLEPTLGTIIFNWRRNDGEDGEDIPLNPFREERVRTALALGIDREEIIAGHLMDQAVPAMSPLMPGLWAYADDVHFPERDEAAAIELLSTAAITPVEDGAEDGSGRVFLEIEILTPDVQPMVAIAEHVAAQWGAIQVRATVDAVDPETYQQRLGDGEFDVALVELSLGSSADPDVYSFWHQGQFPDGENYSAVDDRRISETLERARRDPFGINRAEHYREFQEAFVTRAIAIPLYYPLFTYAVAERVDGVQLGFIGRPSDRLRQILDWQVTE